MVGANVNEMEDQVTLAEGELGTLPGAFKKIFRSVPGFLNVRFVCSVPINVMFVYILTVV